MPATRTVIATREQDEKRARLIRASAMLAAAIGLIPLARTDYVTKPANFEQLTEAIRQIDEFWVKVVTLPGK